MKKKHSFGERYKTVVPIQKLVQAQLEFFKLTTPLEDKKDDRKERRKVDGT